MYKELYIFAWILYWKDLNEKSHFKEYDWFHRYQGFPPLSFSFFYEINNLQKKWKFQTSNFSFQTINFNKKNSSISESSFSPGTDVIVNIIYEYNGNDFFLFYAHNNNLIFHIWMCSSFRPSSLSWMNVWMQQCLIYALF